MNCGKSSAFSLIELMVVIAIVAVLSAVAVPAYKTYTIKSKISNALVILERHVSEMRIAYQTKGVFPSTHTVNGVTFNGGWTHVSDGSYGGIVGFSFIASGDGLGLIATAAIGGLDGVPNYSFPNMTTTGTYGTSTNLSYAIRQAANGTINSACGPYIPGSPRPDIPKEYLPSACQCDYVSNFYVNGVCTAP